jgi:hypothetical protein
MDDEILEVIQGNRLDRIGGDILERFQVVLRAGQWVNQDGLFREAHPSPSSPAIVRL